MVNYISNTIVKILLQTPSGIAVAFCTYILLYIVKVVDHLLDFLKRQGLDLYLHFADERICSQREELTCPAFQLVCGIAESRILISWVSPKGGLTKSSALAQASEAHPSLFPMEWKQRDFYLPDAIMLHFNHMEGIVGPASFLIELHVSCQAFKPHLENKVKWQSELKKCTSTLLAFSAEAKIQNPRMLHRMGFWSSINTKELFTPLPIAGITTRAQFFSTKLRFILKTFLFSITVG